MRAMRMKRILVTGIGGTAALNFVRAIRELEEDIRVVGTDCSPYHIYLAEQVAKKYVIPKSNEEDYVKKLNEIIVKEKIQFLHAQPDVEVERISEDRDKIKAKIFLPDRETVKLCHNKFELIKHLSRERLPAAKSILIEGEEDVRRAFREMRGRIWLRATKGAGGKGSLPVEEFDHARAWVDYWNGWGEFVAEEYLPGKNLAWQAIFKDGDLITSLVWERIEYIISHVSPSGITGTPSVARIVVDEDVNEIATKVVHSFSEEAQGIFSIDFKGNKDGKPCVTEVNPGRFFTPSYMYVRAGINLPGIYVRLALDEPVPKLPKFNAFKEKILWVRGIDVQPVAVKI